LGTPVVQRDYDRALQEWSGEWVVWLLPELKAPISWVEEYKSEGFGYIRFRSKAIPAEHFDRIDVISIGKNGYAVGPVGGFTGFPKVINPQLLDTWLNGWSETQVYFAPEEIVMRVPEFSEGRISSYKEKNVIDQLVPGPMWPIVDVDPVQPTVRFRWPPDELPAASFSPAEESFNYYGQLKREQLEGLTVVKSERRNRKGIPLVFYWPSPISSILPLGGTLDEVLANARMREVAKKSREDSQAALEIALASAGPFVSEGMAALDDLWFFPILVEEGEQAALFAVETAYDISFKTSDELYDSQDWQTLCRKRLPVRRVFGAMGLFWALLLECLEERRGFQTCDRCERIIRGNKKKQYCGREDNLECFRARRAKDKRRSRLKGD
jgi:hypothetical protein